MTKTMSTSMKAVAYSSTPTESWPLILMAFYLSSLKLSPSSMPLQVGSMRKNISRQQYRKHAPPLLTATVAYAIWQSVPVILAIKHYTEHFKSELDQVL